jgi:hypothetical protein
MASDDIDNKALTKMLAEAFKHLTGYSKFRKLNASMEAAIENLFDDESEWSDIVSEGSKKISAASRVIGVLKKRERFYKELGGLIGKPAKSTDEELSRYLKLMDSPLEKAIASDKKWTYALGADTGVRDDFSYLRDTEIRQNERSRFDTMMSRDLRKSLVLPDDVQYAFGADTGVRDDFAYLREEEEAQTRRNIRRNRIRRSRIAATALESMDDYDRFIHENKGRFGREGAEQVFRQRLLKELPPFFKDSKLSTKTLIGIQKTIASARGIPLVGKLMHPAAFGFAAIGIADAYLRASSAANKEVTGWSTSRSMTGSPSRLFDRMARLAGADDEGSVLKLYGALLEKFGTEGAFIPIGQALRGTPKGIARLSMSKSLGLDDKMANLLMYMAGEEPIGATKEAQGTAARESRLRDIQKWGLRSGSSFTEKLRGASLWVPGEKALEARGMSWMDLIEGAAGPSGWGSFIMRKILHPSDRIDEAIEKQIESEGAAESYDQYESSGGSTTNNNVSNNSHAVYINKVDVNTNNPEDFIRNMEGIAESTSGSHANILNSMDSRVMV